MMYLRYERKKLTLESKLDEEFHIKLPLRLITESNQQVVIQSLNKFKL